MPATNHRGSRARDVRWGSIPIQNPSWVDLSEVRAAQASAAVYKPGALFPKTGTDH